MIELLVVIRTALNILAGLREPVRRVLIQPVLTVMLLVLLYGGMHAVRESSLTDGFRVAFLESDAGHAQRNREMENGVLQAELRHFVESNRLIEQLLETVLQRIPGAARVRLDVIHNGVVGLSGTGLLRYDVTHAVAAPGRATDGLVQNKPMSEWTDLLPTLLAAQCLVRATGDLHSQSNRSRFAAMAVGTIMACPVADVQGRLLGALLVTWDLSDQPPLPPALGGLMQLGQQVGAQIAAILDLRGPPPWPTAAASGG